MRLTVVSPAGPTDVEVDEGVPVVLLRRWLARLTGDATWLSFLTADGVPLADEHTAGTAPLRHGATLRLGPCPPPDAVRAARAPLHLAVVAGPDTGALVVPDGPGTLGPGGRFPVADDEAWFVLVRPAPLSEEGARRILPRRRSPSAVQVRGTTSRAWLVSPKGRRRRITSLRWTTWRAGEVLRAGSSTLALRGAARAPTPSRRQWARWTRLLPAVAGVTTSVSLAATMHQPVLLLGALSALFLVGPRGEPTVHAAEPTPDEPLDIAALRVALAGAAGSRAGWPAAGVAPRAEGGHPPVTWASPALQPADVRRPAAWDGDLAVVGPRPAALAAARGIVLAALASEPRVSVRLCTDRPDDWSWLAWIERVTVGPPGRDGRRAAGWRSGDRAPSSLAIVDGAHAVASGSCRVLTIAPAPPPWSATVLAVDGRSARLTNSDGHAREVPFAGVSSAVAEATARALGSRSADEGTAGCPADVRLGDLPGIPPPDAARIAHGWRRSADGAGCASLATPIGSAAGGAPVVVDLVRDGPHAIVAGTTGSGKSELLATLVVGLALAHPPDRLAVLLVDFKGATGLPPALANLPHVVGHLSDLDAAGARRTLRGLSAELRRRERVLAAEGARDLADLDPAARGTPPRLLVVIDEFGALADDLPDLLPSLARLAAQGRSLGVHLVLATQRPAGSVPSDLRANVALRVVLRVADPDDSTDLLGVPDAAGFGRPGLALLARGAGRPEALQVARAVRRRPRAPVRLAHPWPMGGSDERAWVPRPPAAVRPDDGPADWVTAIRAAGADRPTAMRPWLPPLPTRVAASEIPAGPGLPLALADMPEDLSRAPVRWNPEAGHLLVLGGPGSGRSTTLAAVACAALGDGRAVHAIGLPPGLLPRGVASTLDADDLTRVARLTRLLGVARPSTGPRPVLLIDDVAAVLAGLAPLARGAAVECLEQLWASAGGPVAVAASGAGGPATQRLAPFFADRLVLGSPDPTADLLAGIPSDLAGPRAEPGRAVHLGRSCASLCQVALPTHPARAGGGPAGPVVRTLPRLVSGPLPTDHSGTGGPLVGIGLGGDDARVVAVDLSHPLLVVGPSGSGRSTALGVLAAGVAATGRTVVPLNREDDLADDGVLLVVDDLDELEARDPALADAVAARLAARRDVRLVAATTTAHAVAAFRGPVPALVRARRLLVLDLVEPGSVDLLGPEGPWLVDPRRRPPGRGALRLGRAVVPVQVAAHA